MPLSAGMAGGEAACSSSRQLRRCSGPRLCHHHRDTAGPAQRAANGARPAALELGFYEEVEGSDGEPHKRSTLGFHALRHTCASLLFAARANVSRCRSGSATRIQAFTLRTYVHLMDEGLGSGLDLDDSEGNGWATQALPNPANPVEVGSSKRAG